MSVPKILIIDIETAPMEVFAWGLYDQNIALNQIKKDWSILSWAAKWLGDKKVIQEDIEQYNEQHILLKLRNLLDEADIVIGQNSKQFDVKKINARLLHYGIRPPSSYQQIDTKLVAKKYFAFTSNSLEYMSDKFNKKFKKLKHKKFPGMELWTECLKGNKKAWKAMREYNIFDVLATEELYKKLQPWDKSINFNVYYGKDSAICACGSEEFSKNGYAYTANGKYQRYECKKCGCELKSRQNLNKKQLTFNTK
jgi:DNA polymerase elongation subunit (family B)